MADNMVQISRVAYEASQKVMANLRSELESLKKAKPGVSIDPNPAILAELAQVKQVLEQSQEENRQLRAARIATPELKNKTPTMKVGEKGGVCVYGLGRFPVTQYKEQWHKLLDMADDIRAFIVEHDSELKTK